MEQITLGDIATWAAFIAAFAGSVSAIISGVKRVVKKLLVPLAMDNAKNYIIPFLARVERGEPFSQIELERFHEEFKFYRDNGGNSYVADKVEKLKANGKL